MPEPVNIPPPEGVAPGLAGMTAGFGLLVAASAAGIILTFGLMSGDAVAWGMAGCTFSPIAALGLGLVTLGWHFWRLRREPLVVESGGVSYRGKVVAGAVRRLVLVKKVVHDEAGPVELYDLFADTAGGEVELPAPYFTTFTLREQAEAVAGRVAEALGVEVVWRD